jgi:hypothetical protein
MIIIQFMMTIGQRRYKLPYQLLLVKKKRSSVAKNVSSPIVENRAEIIPVAEPGPWGVLYVV